MSFFKRIPMFIQITLLIVLIILGIYWCITWNFDFVRIQDVKSKDLNRLKSIQIIETLKLVLLITTPILTMILFLNTINVQKLNSENLGKDSMSKDFYNLLGLFKQEQEKSKASLQTLGRSVKSKLDTVVYQLQVIDINKSYPDERLLENEYYSKQCPNYLRITNETDIKQCEKNIKKYKIAIGHTFDDIRDEYKNSYSEVGTYFRILHRLIKVINDRFENGIINEDERMLYIGIIRAQLSLDELLVVLVNSLEIKKGIGLGVELMGSSFFGDSVDIDDGQHFDCPDIYRDNLKKYFVRSIDSEKKRKIFRENFIVYRGNEEINNFQSLLDKIDSKKTNVR